jgi:hypothetical protein
MKDHLLLNRCCTSAPRVGPANAGPSSSREPAFPGLSLIDKMMFVSRPAAIANVREFISQIVVQPVCNLLSELLVSGSKAQLHATSPSSN